MAHHDAKVLSDTDVVQVDAEYREQLERISHLRGEAALRAFVRLCVARGRSLIQQEKMDASVPEKAG